MSIQVWFRFVLALAVVMSVAASPALAGSGNQGEWVSNGEVAMRVDRVEALTSWDRLGPFIRFDASAREKVKDVQALLRTGEYKVVVVHMSMRNVGKAPAHLGYGVEVTSVNAKGTGVLWLRGEEGTQFPCANDLLKSRGATGITYYLKNGLPLDAEIAPGGVVTGRVAFLVPSWFVPAKVFTKAQAWPYRGYGKSDNVVNLR